MYIGIYFHRTKYKLYIYIYIYSTKTQNRRYNEAYEN